MLEQFLIFFPLRLFENKIFWHLICMILSKFKIQKEHGSYSDRKLCLEFENSNLR